MASGKIIFVILAIVTLALFVPAAMCSPAEESSGPGYEWMKFFESSEGEINSVWQLSDGSYVAGGKGENGRELIGLDKSGEIVWENKIPGGDENGTVRFIQESPLGGLYLFTDGENLIKTTVAGDVEWMYHQPVGVISSIEVADSGNVLMSGDFYQSFLTMVGSDGTELWNRSMGSPEGGGQYRLTSVQGTPDGGFVIAGYINPIMSTEKYHGFVMKTDADGDQKWAKQYRYDDSAMIITITPVADGGYAAGMVGITDQDISLNEDNAGYISYILLLNDEGEMISKNIVPDIDIIYYINSASDGGYYILGKKYDTLTDSTDYRLIKADSDGSLEWMKSFGNIRISSVHKTDDGGLLLAGIDEETKKGVIIKMLPEGDKEEKSPGFGVFVAICAVFCALCVLKHKNRL